MLFGWAWALEINHLGDSIRRYRYSSWMSTPRNIGCGNFAENLPLNSFSISFHLNVLITDRHYSEEILTSMDIYGDPGELKCLDVVTELLEIKELLI